MHTQTYAYINKGTSLALSKSWIDGLPRLAMGKTMVTRGSIILGTPQMQLAQVTKHSKELKGFTAKMETEENKVPVERVASLWL